ncbi:hypothetical protein AgCh_030205 [Apium graveolens]
MEIPLGLIPCLMTKGESAWRKVKIGGSRAKFPSGVFRRCNLVIFLGFAFSLVLCAEAGQQPEAAETSEGSMNSFDSGSWITKWYGRGMESSNAGSDPGEGPSFIQRRVPGESTGPQYVHVSSDTDRRGPPAEQEAPQLPPSEPPAQPAAGPSNANSTFPYDENHTIGGDSVASIRNRILANAGDISYEEAHYRAEDLFEIKTKLIQRMAQWDIDGDWMNRGARALDYPKTKSGEYSLDQLYAFHSDLEKYGPMSDTFSLLKEKSVETAMEKKEKQHSGNALKSEVLRLREDIFLMDAGLGTPIICMQDAPTGVPINRTTRFENKVGSLDLVAGESPIKKHILERFFIDLVAGESLIKERAAARFKKLVGSTDVVAGEPLLLPRRFRKNRAWMKLNKIWRTNTKRQSMGARAATIAQQESSYQSRRTPMSTPLIKNYVTSLFRTIVILIIGVTT